MQVALQTGYLEPPGKELVRAPRKQVVVVLTSDWQVICYDHNLQTKWNYTLRTTLPRHSTIKEVSTQRLRCSKHAILPHTCHSHCSEIVLQATCYKVEWLRNLRGRKCMVCAHKLVGS